MNSKYFWYAIAVTAISTVMSWASMFSNLSSSSSGRGSSFSSGSTYRGGGGGGHK